ncbi:hypothetical protein ET532_003850, partial [Verminephrobacter sp. Larva24]
VGLRWPSKRIAALHRLPIRSVLAVRCALRCAPMAARSLRHLIGDATRAGQAPGAPAPPGTRAGAGAIAWRAACCPAAVRQHRPGVRRASGFRPRSASRCPGR